VTVHVSVPVPPSSEYTPQSLASVFPATGMMVVFRGEGVHPPVRPLETPLHGRVGEPDPVGPPDPAAAKEGLDQVPFPLEEKEGQLALEVAAGEVLGGPGRVIPRPLSERVDRVRPVVNEHHVGVNARAPEPSSASAVTGGEGEEFY
jgi:hypothetical protein